MISRKLIAFNVQLISIALLVGQAVALVHGVEHPFHQLDDTCQVFFALEESENGQTTEGPRVIETPVLLVAVAPTKNKDLLSSIDAAFNPRAPPLPST